MVSREVMEGLNKRLSEIRRTIHSNPELGFEEFETSALIAHTLEELGLKVQCNVNKTGVVGLLEGTEPGPVIALRADMDALPIQEINETPYKSQNPGVMHACGHDGNTTMLLGAAMILSSERDTLPGTVKFIFQPSEESPPGGAKGMIEEGVMENPKVSAIIGAHVDPEVRTGMVSTRIGSHTANANRIKIRIKGKGGHAAYPHKCIDPVYISSFIVQALHGLSSRVANPVEPFVVTLGKIAGGDTFNVIPNEVEILGTVRTLTDETKVKMLEQIKVIVETIPKIYGGEGSMEYSEGYPAGYNDEGLTRSVAQSCENELGKGTVISSSVPSMGGEDFAYFSQLVPGTVIQVGVRNEEKGFVYPWHHARFDLDEDGLVAGARCLARAAKDFLEQHQK